MTPYRSSLKFYTTKILLHTILFIGIIGCSSDKGNSPDPSQKQTSNFIETPQQGSMAEIKVDRLRMRTAPSLDSETVMLIAEGTLLPLTGRKSDSTEIIQIAGEASRQYWYEIEYGDTLGWIYGGGLTIVDQPEDPFLIIPGVCVGRISRDDTEASLTQKFGQENVIRSDIPIADSIISEGTILFPGTDKELTILWEENDFKTLFSIEISHPRSPYHTNQGITIGSTLSQVEKINGRKFSLYGFDWDYGGKVHSWENGALSTSLFPFFTPNQEEYHQSLKGDVLLYSDNSRLSYTGAHISKIKLYF